MVSGASATPTLGRARPAVASMPRGVRADIVALYCYRKPSFPGFARRLGPSSLKEAGPNVGCAAHTLATASSTEAVASGGKNVTYEEDAKGITRLSLRMEGWSSWDFEGGRVNYLQAGTEGPPLLLIHGFGASVYHWRYNIPELAKKHRVYALDMLGFGWSDKPITDYGSCRIWVRQVAGFIQDVILQGSDDPSLPRPVVVGNSLGGWVALNTATDEPELVQAVVLVNAAGRLEEPAAAGDDAQATEPQNPGALQKAWQQLAAAGQQLVKRAGAYVAFLSSKQRSNVERVLSQVYVSQDNLDDELVESILAPAEHPNAAQVFYLTMQQSGGRTMTSALAQCKKPLHLIWGERDPWITPSKAQRVQQLYPSATVVMLDAGHCPHDDAPQPFNQALLEYMRSVHA